MQHPSALPPHMRKFRAPYPLPSGSGRGGGRSNLKSSTNFFHLRRKSERDFNPIKWNDCFTSKHDIKINNNDLFRIYLNQDIQEEQNQDDDDIDNDHHQQQKQTTTITTSETAKINVSKTLPLLLLLHGGGFSALTWAMFVKSLKELCHVQVMAIDIRGHGSTKTTNDEDLSVTTIVDDITKILLKMFDNGDDDDCLIPELILMGHSMGGALAAHFVDKCQSELISSRIIGLIVIDVVEGTAKEALSQMQQVLRSRPKGFRSIEHAIEWCIRSGQTKNLDSAKISMPGQIKHIETGICAADLIDDDCQNKNKDPSSTSSSSSSSPLSSSPTTTITSLSYSLPTLNETDISSSSSKETDETMIINEQNSLSSSSSSSSLNYIWRIDLYKTEPYWMEWFNKLSEIFLNSSKGGAKMLLLAGVDRLDGPMTIGQMQGKFQMQILPRVGHVIQEDDPDRVAQVVASYLVRNRFSTSKIDFERPFPSC